MLARLVTPLRVVLVVILFATAVSSHDAAMANGPTGILMPGMTTISTAAHAHDGAACKAHHCNANVPPCCVAGQCLLGILEFASFAFTDPAKPEHTPRPLMVPAPSSPQLPFRPPAVS